MDKERLLRRVDGREQAKSILGLVALDHPDTVDAFLDELRSTLQPTEVVEDAVAAKKRLSDLAGQVLTFGTHAGKRLDDIPRDYLHWLAGTTESTLELLNAYLGATKHLDEE